MRKQDKEVIAIFLADIHLSMQAPIWRSIEEDWFEAMARPLREIYDLQKKYDCPVFGAGDIFDRWNSSPELINFALDYLPDKIYAIPGQHDLPQHNYKDIRRSAYWTLVKARKIENIRPKHFIKMGQMIIHGFPYGFPIHPLDKKWEGDKVPGIHIAIVHEYIWIPGNKYSKALPEQQLTASMNKKFKGYDVVIFGDNHKGFYTSYNYPTIFNCGTLMRRKSDEIDYKPQIGLLLNTGEVKSHLLDTSKDKYLETMNKTSTIIDGMSTGEFFRELEKLGDTNLDFIEAIKLYMIAKKVKPEIKKVILKAIEDSK